MAAPCFLLALICFVKTPQCRFTAKGISSGDSGLGSCQRNFNITELEQINALNPAYFIPNERGEKVHSIQ